MNTASKTVCDLPGLSAHMLRLVQLSLVASLFLGLFGALLPGLVRDWYEKDTYSYGFLVPCVFGFLIWKRRELLRRLPVASNYWASIILLLAVVLALIGQSIGDSFIPRWSMILGLAGTVWFLLGNAWMRALLFPIYYLSLMIPVPYSLVKELTFVLRYADATHAANLLSLLGIPVHRDSYFLYLPNITLEVADVCSGVSSIFALFALAVVYAHVLPLHSPFKLGLVLMSIPCAIVANLFRILLTAVLAFNYGSMVFQSTFHALSGVFTFLVALVLLVALGEGLRKRFASMDRPVSAGAEPHGAPSSYVGKVPWPAFALCSMILGGAVGLSFLLDNSKKMALTSPLDGIMIGTEATSFHLAPEDYYRDRHAQEVLSRNVSTGVGEPIHLFVAYSGYQDAATRLNSPKLVFPDQWNFVWIKESLVELPNQSVVRGNWMLTRKGDDQQLVFYWYQLGEKTIAGEIENRLAQARRAFMERRSDAAVVRLSTMHRQGEPIEQAERRITAIIAEFYPELVKRLPA